jgi:four helix bundle protein
MNDVIPHQSPTPRYGLYGLDAYRVAIEFYQRLRTALTGRRGHVIDQVSRAAESVVLNIAEAHPTTGPDRKRRFRIAANEAAECQAALDLLQIRRDLTAAALDPLRALLDRERAMLWRLSR